jgi:hypothetical protein
VDSGMNIANKHQYSKTNAFLHLLEEVFQQNGWNTILEPGPHHPQNLIIEKPGLRYIAAFKSASDGKRGRLLPLLSMAILESKTAANAQTNLRPMAVVMAPHIEENVAEEISKFVLAHASDVAIGVVDYYGLRRFWGEGLQNLDSKRPPDFHQKVFKSNDAVSNIFSDVNQWLLKVILGQRLPEQIINVPRGEFRNASQLSHLANVSVMSAFRLLRQLENEGFLDVSASSPRLVNIERMLSRWQSAMLKPQKEFLCRWLIRGGNEEKLMNSIRDYRKLAGDDGMDGKFMIERQPRLCLGGSVAASLLGFGHVSGIPPLLYVERISVELLRRLGLARIEDSRPADVLVKIPPFKESLFRPAVVRNDIFVSDILQTWLESSMNPVRGIEQAGLIKTRLLDRMIHNNL